MACMFTSFATKTGTGTGFKSLPQLLHPKRYSHLLHNAWLESHGPERQMARSLQESLLRKDAEKQQPLLQEAVSIFAKHFGSDHPEVASKKVCLAVACAALGDNSEAQRLLEDAHQ